MPTCYFCPNFRQQSGQYQHTNALTTLFYARHPVVTIVKEGLGRSIWCRPKEVLRKHFIIFYRDLFRCKFLEYRADLYTKLEAKRLKWNEREKKVLGGDSDSADEHQKQVTQHGYVTVVLGSYL